MAAKGMSSINAEKRSNLEDGSFHAPINVTRARIHKTTSRMPIPNESQPSHTEAEGGVAIASDLHGGLYGGWVFHVMKIETIFRVKTVATGRMATGRKQRSNARSPGVRPSFEIGRCRLIRAARQSAAATDRSSSARTASIRPVFPFSSR